MVWTLATLLVASAINCAVAFMPNYVFQFILRDTGRTLRPFDGSYSHKDIIREASLRSVARLFEDLKSGEIEPGDLVGLDPLTPGTLFSAVHGGVGKSSSLSLEEALDQIEAGAARVDQNPEADSSEAKKHFDNEKILEGNRYLRKKRQDLMGFLLADDDQSNVSSPSMRMARRQLGECLLTLQDFYAHTNYVEMGRNVPLRELGVEKNLSIPLAGMNEETCSNCPSPLTKKCLRKNLIVKDRLTSGYFIYEKDEPPTKKPDGKCSHGDFEDSSRSETPEGGINKSTKDITKSPHFYLHQEAVDLARQATELFLDGIREEVGDKKYQKLFGLTAIYEEGISLCFVVDTTGSMHNDIASVARRVEQIMQSGKKASRFVLVPFNDNDQTPAFGPPFVGKSLTEFRDAINRLRARGGGNCPELALHGLRLALQTCDPRSSVYVFTDAGASDVELKDEVISLIEAKKSRVTFFYTGRPNRPPCGGEPAATLYDNIATRSSGQVLPVSKIEVAKATVVTLGESGPLTATLLNAQNSNSLRLKFFVDCTITAMTVSIASNESTTINVKVTDPNNKLWTKSKSSIGKVFENPVGGVWTVVAKARSYFLTGLVTGATHVDVSVELVDKRGRAGHPGIYLRQDQPLQESEVHCIVSVTGVEQIDGLTHVDVIGLDGKVISKELESLELEQGSLTSSNVFAVTFISPLSPFQIKVVGSACGTSFQRLSRVFTPGPMGMKEADGAFGVEVRSKISDFITATVDNKDGFVREVSSATVGSPVTENKRRRRRQTIEEKRPPLLFTVKKFVEAGQKLVITIIPAIPKTAEIGSVGTVIVKASTSDGKSINSATLDIPVVPKELDEDPPVCVVVSNSGSGCDGLTTRTCDERRWSLVVNVTDYGVGLKRVAGLEDDVNVLPAFRHLRDSKKTESVTATVVCCQRVATIQAKDSVGNEISCPAIDLKPLPLTKEPPPTREQPSTSPTVRPTTERPTPTTTPTTEPPPTTEQPSTNPTVRPTTERPTPTTERPTPTTEPPPTTERPSTVTVRPTTEQPTTSTAFCCRMCEERNSYMGLRCKSGEESGGYGSGGNGSGGDGSGGNGSGGDGSGGNGSGGNGSGGDGSGGNGSGGNGSGGDGSGGDGSGGNGSGGDGSGGDGSGNGNGGCLDGRIDIFTSLATYHNGTTQILKNELCQFVGSVWKRNVCAIELCRCFFRKATDQGLGREGWFSCLHPTTVTPTATVTSIPMTTATASIPTATVISIPTAHVTSIPTSAVLSIPKATVTSNPTSAMTSNPTATVTSIPTATATSISKATVTSIPTSAMTSNPTATATSIPKATVTSIPTSAMTSIPTATVTLNPTATVTSNPEATVTSIPEAMVTSIPTATVILNPTATVTSNPEATVTSIPEAMVTSIPTATVILNPTATVTSNPEATVTSIPEATVTSIPTARATSISKATVTLMPTSAMTSIPTATVTSIPTATSNPTATAISIPTSAMTSNPTATATSIPKATVTSNPTATVTSIPMTTAAVTSNPTATVTSIPETTVTSIPEATVTSILTARATSIPKETVTLMPTSAMTSNPTATANSNPTATVTSIPEATATSNPTATVTPNPTPSTTCSTACTQCEDVCKPGDSCSDGFGKRLDSILYHIVHPGQKIPPPQRSIHDFVNDVFLSFIMYGNAGSDGICRFVRSVWERDACAMKLCSCFFSRKRDHGLEWRDWSYCMTNAQVSAD